MFRCKSYTQMMKSWQDLMWGLSYKLCVYILNDMPVSCQGLTIWPLFQKFTSRTKHAAILLHWFKTEASLPDLKSYVSLQCEQWLWLNWSSWWNRRFNTLRPRQNCRHFTNDISNAFSLMKIYEFCLRFYLNLFLRFQLTIFQHWFR